MVDLHFAEARDRYIFRCDVCKPHIAKGRKCQDDGYENLKAPMRVDKMGMSFKFCPGKATWDEEIVNLFEKCMVALETGILPEQGALDDQDALFVEVFPIFIQRWKARRYNQVWGDVREYVQDVLKAVLGKK